MTTDFEQCRAAALARLSTPGATADPAALTEVIDLLRTAADLVPVGHPDRAAYLSNVGNVYRLRYTAGGAPGDLDHALAYAKRTVAEADPADRRRAGMLANLCGILRLSFERNLRASNLDAAISTGTEAVRVAAHDDPNRADIYANLAIAHQARFELTAASSDLDAAIAEARTAVELPSATNWTHRSNLAGMLWLRYRRFGHTRDLDECITTSRQAIEIASHTDPLVAATLSNLSIALRMRFERSHADADLDESITTGERAMALLTPGRLEWAAITSNLGLSHRARFTAIGRRADIDRAIELGEMAVAAVPGDDHRMAVYLSNVGGALWDRLRHSGDPRDRVTAIDLLGQAAGIVGAPAFVRTTAAEAAARLAAGGGDWSGAADFWDEAFAQLPQLVGATLGARDREHHLVRMGALAREAAAGALQLADERRAVRLLETGRGVALGRALQINRELARLAETQPDRAAALRRLGRELGDFNAETDPMTGTGRRPRPELR